MADPAAPPKRKQLRALWRSAWGALALAGLAVGFGVVGYGQVTAEPEHRVEFVIDDGLPYGITQESVEYAAEQRGLRVYEPFTLHVVERDLDWAEHYRGEIGEADVLLSMGDDVDDPDLSLSDFTRVAFDGEDSGDHYRAATEIRATFINNRTLGHGPSAVVGAASTAADMYVDDGNRSALFWGSLTALPLFAACGVMYLWLRDRRAERERKRRFDAGRLRLARSVLEVDALEARVSAAGDRSLRNQWRGVRRRSMELARVERDLGQWAVLKPEDEEALAKFEADTLELHRRADAVAAAAELHAGHAGSRTVLDQLAAPVVQAVDDVLGHADVSESRDLRELRGELLGLLGEAATANDEGPEPNDAERDDDAEAAGLVERHAELLSRWNDVEARLIDTARRLERAGRNSRNTGQNIPTEEELRAAAEERSAERLRAMTVGETESLTRLRTLLGLATPGPLKALERVLTVRETGFGALRADATPARARVTKPVSPTAKVGIGVGIVAPLAVGLIAGWIAVADADTNTRYGRTLVGDQPLHSLSIYGDLDLVPAADEEPEGSPLRTPEITLDYVRYAMDRSLRSSDDAALLPEQLDLIVAVLPIDDYADYTDIEENPERRAAGEGRVEIDYWDMLEAYQQIKTDVSVEYPELLDPVTGEVVQGQAVMPIWIFPDGAWAIGGTLTGEISAGVDSRLGTYSFTYTEPFRRAVPAERADLTAADLVPYELQKLGRIMEYNHQETGPENTSGIFWTVALAFWAGAQTLVLAGVAVVESGRRRAGTRASRAQLKDLRAQLDRLALGLDLSRLDMVAVLGGESGDAAVADQRLYESSLVTAWREVQHLEDLPRAEQSGEDWESRVRYVQRLVDTLAQRDRDVAHRANELLRAQRAHPASHSPNV